MDLSQDASYRGVNVNDAAPSGPGGRLVGTQIEEVRYGGVQGVGWTEKRSNADGRDASDVFLDGRTFYMRATTYGETKADLTDRLQAIRSAFTPTASYTDDPGAYGFVPFYFKDATAASASWPSGYIDKYLKLRPRVSPNFAITRDKTGGKAALGGGVTWEVVMDAIDPRVYVYPDTVYDFANDATSDTDDLVNRGDYPAPINLLLVVATQAKPGYFTLEMSGSAMVIAIPQSASTQVFRYNGYLKVLTRQIGSGFESLAMSLLSWLTEVEDPQVAPDPAAGEFTWSSVWSGGGSVYQTIPMADGSRLWYAESFA